MSEHSQAVLVVEDSPQDFEVTVRSLREAGVEREVLHCEDGDDAIDLLEGMATEDRGLPCLILLDLNLPGSSGHDVLTTIRQSPALQHIPVVVLTTSAADRDIDESYRLGANSYIQKPVNLDAFRTSMTQFVAYWFSTVILPVQSQEVRAA